MGIGGGNTNPRDPTIPGSSSGSGGGSTWNNSSGRGSTDPQSVWGGQSQFLQDLYGRSRGRMRDIEGMGLERANSMYNQAAGGFNRMMNPEVNPQLQAYAGDVQRNFDRNIMPSIQSDAGQFGQMGGARQGVAEGIAAGEANQQVTDMASNLYNADMNRMGQAMSMAPSLGQFGQQIPWYAMNQYAGILGSPTTLGGGSRYESESSGGGRQWNESSGTTASGGGGGGGWQGDVHLW